MKFNKKIKRVILAISITALLLSSCSSGQSPKVYRVGILSGLGFLADTADGFKEGMAELGYVEGENIVYDVQQTEFDMEAYRSILQKFVEDEVDLIVSFPTEATMEAKAATQGTDIPVVFTYALIEGMGIVDSVREPGGNGMLSIALLLFSWRGLVETSLACAILAQTLRSGDSRFYLNWPRMRKMCGRPTSVVIQL